MRGTRQHLAWIDQVRGIIPAYAGNTSPRRRTGRLPGDHPRVCGEHLCRASSYWTSEGSSPRMRGTLFLRIIGLRFGRIIPAYAGNTEARSTPACPKWDHPRVCGEHQHDGKTVLVLQGSSPRMRGTHRHDSAGTQRTGIIPAYAGNTLSVA